VRSFITGITGFAGGFLAEHLIASGDDVAGTTRWPREAASEIELVHWDIADLSSDANLFEKLRRFAPDVIYHLAALAIPDDCGAEWPTPEAGMINIGGTSRIVELACALPHRPRLLFVSTCHVYAPVTFEHFLVDENSPLDPRAGYGASKLAAEAVVQRAARTQNLDVVIARAFQHTGPRQAERLMLSSWCSQFTAGVDPVEVYNRDTWIDLTDVRDIVRAYRLLVERGERGEIYNVGSGRCIRTGDIFDELRRQADPQRRWVELRPGAKQNWIADNRRLVECTGWQARVAVERTVADTLEHWRHRERDPSQAV
jgi:GDP-4-dehydro-6-deoxy-D-mannose reductase